MPTKARDQGWKELDTTSSRSKRDEFYDSQVLSDASSIKQFQTQRQQWRKNGENKRKSRHGSWRKSETNMRWSLKQGMKAEKKREPQHQKYEGRVVLRGDIVKDDSGSYGVFTEQGSLASQVTASKVMYIISRLPGCAGQAADAVSAYTQVKMEDASTLLKVPESECPDIGIRLPKHTIGQNHGPAWKIQSFLLKGICTVILWQDHYEKGNLEHGWEKFWTGNVSLSTEQEDNSYQCMWTISNWQAKQKTQNRLGKFSWKTLTWKNQHHILTMYIWDALKESVRSEENESVGELSTVCSQIVLTCLYLGRIGRPDKRLARVISHTFITHVNTGNIVMWVTQHNNADKDYSKILTVQETLKIRNQHLVDSHAFSEGKHLCQQVKCARNRRQCLTAQQKLKFFLLMQVYAWTEFPRLIFGT